jgi:hypothetical protein
LPILLIENKSDLVEENQSEETGLNEFARKNKFVGAFRTSSKTGLNVDESINYLLLQIIAKLENSNNMENEIKDKSFVIQKTKLVSHPEKRSNCC